MSTLTTKLGMSKPADSDTDWGDEIRGALDIIDAALISHYFAENVPHTGLDFAYKEGLYRKDNVLVTINSGAVTLTDDTTNYVFIDISTDSVATNTTGVASGNIPLFTVVTASGAITTVTDIRSLLSADVTLSHNHDSSYFTEEELGSTTNGSAGADLIGMTAIPDVSGATTLQSFLEALVTLLKAVTDSASGADLIGATAIDGLGEQATVQAILEALYSAIPSITGLLDETAHDLLDHTGLTGIPAANVGRGICFSINNVDLATTQTIAITAPCALKVTGGKLEVGTAPTGAALICDIHKNGTTLWTTQGNRPTIADAGTSATITAPDVISIAQGDRLLLMIDQVGSTVAGKDLSLTLYCEVA